LDGTERKDNLPDQGPEPIVIENGITYFFLKEKFLNKK